MLSEAKSKHLLRTEVKGAAFSAIKTALPAALLLAKKPVAVHCSGLGSGYLQHATRAVLQQKWGVG
jgi:hypothetical protein